MKTWNEWTKNVIFDESNQAKNTDEILNLQLKIANAVLKSVGNYAEKMSEILKDAATQGIKIINDISNETMNNISSASNKLHGTHQKSSENIKSDKHKT